MSGRAVGETPKGPGSGSPVTGVSFHRRGPTRVPSLGHDTGGLGQDTWEGMRRPRRPWYERWGLDPIDPGEERESRVAGGRTSLDLAIGYPGDPKRNEGQGVHWSSRQ